VQMQFSEKRASTWIKSTLALARDHAVEYKGLKRSRLVVCTCSLLFIYSCIARTALMIIAESWVSKERFGPKKVDIKGRGRSGIKRVPYARLNVLLKEGKTREEKEEAKFRKDLGMVRSAGMVREDGKLRRKVISDWTW